MRVANAFQAEVGKLGPAAGVEVRVTGCHGYCEKGPNVVVGPAEICYFEVKPEDVPEIVARTLTGEVVERLVYAHPGTGEKAVHMDEVPFYKHQTRLLIGDNPRIDPMRIDDYLALGGYAALAKALFQMTPDQVRRRGEESQPARPRRRRISRRTEMGDRQERARGRASTSSSTATRASPARSWTARCSPAIRTRCSRA